MSIQTYFPWLGPQNVYSHFEATQYEGKLELKQTMNLTRGSENAFTTFTGTYYHVPTLLGLPMIPSKALLPNMHRSQYYSTGYKNKQQQQKKTSL
jgi:hypothetical protein